MSSATPLAVASQYESVIAALPDGGIAILANPRAVPSIAEREPKGRASFQRRGAKARRNAELGILKIL